MNNPYVKYYVAQQTGQGMPVFKGSGWQRGYGQVGYGLGGFFKVPIAWFGNYFLSKV